MTEHTQTVAENRKLREILERSINEIYVFREHDLKFTFVNECALNNLGYTSEECRELTPVDLKPEFTEATFRNLFAPLAEGTENLLIFNTTHRRKNGTHYPVEVHLQKSTASDETEFVAVIYDATQMINARAQSRLTFENVAQCLLEIGRELNSRQPLDARMTKVCEVTVRLLSCDRCSIFLLDDGYYRAKWNFGNPPDIQERFPEFKVSTEDPLVTKAVQAKHYVLVNDPIRDSLMNTETAIAARIRSLCVVPILGLGEDALGFMTAEFNERDGAISGTMASIALGLADLVGRTITEEHTYVERAELAAQLEQVNKLDALGRLAGGVAHDLNNLLQVIFGYSSVARSALRNAEPAIDAIANIESAAERAGKLVGQLLAFARKQPAQRRVIDLNTELKNIVGWLRRLVPEDIVIRWRPGSETSLVRLDPSQLSQVVLNLVSNARDAISGSGTITISTDSIHVERPSTRGGVIVDAGTYARIAVSDDGHGIDSQSLGRIFEPFYTSKSEGSGTGLGLASVHGISLQNGGFVEVESEVGRGSTFYVCLPKLSEDAPVDAPRPPAASHWPGDYTILVVEDRSEVLDLVTGMLHELGYGTVLRTSSPLGAINLAQGYSGVIHLLLTDVVLEESNGRELARQLVSMRPELRVLYMSGHPADVIASRGIVDSEVKLLSKPFNLEALAVAVRDALADQEVAEQVDEADANIRTRN